MLKLAHGKPVAIMLEQSRGPLVYALMFRENVLLYPVNPKQLVRYRESYPGGGKDDPTDARYLARMLRERITTLACWQPDDENTRLLAHLSRQRRKLVDGQTKLRQQLIAQLKSYFPIVSELFGKDSQLPLVLSLLDRWPDPRKLRRADRRLIRRVLNEHAIRNGIAPVTYKSGKQCLVQRRYACPKFLRQTFHEFADSARKYCPWTKARYRMLRDRGMKHHATLRKIARSWIRILFRVWQTGIPFDCDRYIVQLQQRCPEITPYLEQKE